MPNDIKEITDANIDAMFREIFAFRSKIAAARKLFAACEGLSAMEGLMVGAYHYSWHLREMVEAVDLTPGRRRA